MAAVPETPEPVGEVNRFKQQVELGVRALSSSEIEMLSIVSKTRDMLRPFFFWVYVSQVCLVAETSGVNNCTESRTGDYAYSYA